MTSIVEKLQGLKANLEDKQFYKGDLSTLAMGVVIAVMVMFMGIYMISMVSDLTSVNNSSSFYSMTQTLVTSTATVYNVLILVIVITALGVAIAVLRGFGSPTPASGGM